MNSKIRISVVCLFAMAAITSQACSSKKSNKPNPLRQYILSPNIFDGYYLQDQACQEQTSGSNLFSNTKVYEYSPNESKSVLVTNTSIPFQAIHSLAGSQIDTTYYNLHQRQDCSAAGSSMACDSELLLVTPPIPLKVCNPNQEFKRNSVEQVGLSSLYQLEKAAAFYKKVQSSSLEKTFLSILPKIEIVSRISDQVISEFVTDQMSYVRTEDGSGGFFIYPRSENIENANIWRNLNFWEWGWAVSHEFGHHVLTELTGYIGGEVSLISKKTLDERPHFMAPPIISAQFLQPRILSESSLREVTTEDLIGVIHEAYADLFGFYSDGGRANALIHIDCFAFNRDVSSSKFANGQSKIMSENVLAIFNSSTIEAGSKDCSEPLYQDIHTIGSIVAHGINKIYTAKVSTTEGRAKLLFAWAKRLTYLKQSNLKLEDLIGDGIYAASNSGSLNAAQCEAMQTYFPAYYSKWTAGSGKVKLSCN